MIKIHFQIQVAWFIAAMTHGFDRAVIANGRGSLQFLQKLYDTSGQCLECDLRTCSPVEGINKDISFVHNVFAFKGNKT